MLGRLKVWTHIENNNLTTFNFFLNFNYSILPNMGNKSIFHFLFTALEPSHWRPSVNIWDFIAELSSYDSRITILLAPSKVKWLTRFSLLQVFLFLVLSPRKKEWGYKCLTNTKIGNFERVAIKISRINLLTKAKYQI